MLILRLLELHHQKYEGSWASVEQLVLEVYTTWIQWEAGKVKLKNICVGDEFERQLFAPNFVCYWSMLVSLDC